MLWHPCIEFGTEDKNQGCVEISFVKITSKDIKTKKRTSYIDDEPIALCLYSMYQNLLRFFSFDVSFFLIIYIGRVPDSYRSFYPWIFSTGLKSIISYKKILLVIRFQFRKSWLCFRYSTQAKMVDTGTGTLYIIGSFKRMTTDPDFKVWIYIIKFIKYIFSLTFSSFN